MSGTFSCETLPVLAWCDVEDWTILDRLCRPLGWLSVTRKKNKRGIVASFESVGDFCLVFFFLFPS
jgi:hypothetical protein